MIVEISSLRIFHCLALKSQLVNSAALPNSLGSKLITDLIIYNIDFSFSRDPFRHRKALLKVVLS